MCLAIPMKITEIDGAAATVDASGVTRRARIDLLGDVSVGDYVLIHAGLAIAKVDPEEAEHTLATLREFGI
jgi:hydrogenase expression/formation protein HypC